MINEQIKKEVVFKKEQAKPSVKVNPPKKKTKPHHRRNVKSLAIPNQIEEIVKNFKNHNIQDQNMFKPHAVSRNNSPNPSKRRQTPLSLPPTAPTNTHKKQPTMK